MFQKLAAWLEMIANSAQELDALMSTIRTASIRGRGGSTPNSRGGIAAFDAAPELLLCREEEALVEGVRRDRDLNQLAAPGDDGERRQLGIADPHVVLQLRRVFFGRPSSVNDHGSMNLASTRPSRVAAIQRTTGCNTRRWTRGRTWPVLRSNPVEGFGDHPEPNDEVARQILGLFIVRDDELTKTKPISRARSAPKAMLHYCNTPPKKLALP